MAAEQPEAQAEFDRSMTVAFDGIRPT